MAVRTWAASGRVVDVDFDDEPVGHGFDAIDDQTLALRAAREPAAFAPLYQRYVRPIYGYCYQRLGSRELAEDATSQTFAKALAALPRYRNDAFRAWLFTIAHHTVADVYRRRPTASLEAAAAVPDPYPSPEEQALRADADRGVQRLIALLTPEQRDVVELRLAGLGGAEIAAVLGRRQGAIRGTEFRAYKRLRAVLTARNLGDGVES